MLSTSSEFGSIAASPASLAVSGSERSIGAHFVALGFFLVRYLKGPRDSRVLEVDGSLYSLDLPERPARLARGRV